MFASLTLENFLDHASRYNLEMYPSQYILLAIGILALLLVFFRTKNTGKIISAILAFFYAWIGILFYLVYFSEFMPVHFVFAILFILQALIFTWEGSVRNRIIFRFKADLNGLTGAFLLFYAVFGYQALEYIFGRGYPEILSFGMFPCPTVIFSLGMLLWTEKRFPAYILIIPLLHALSGFIPAFIIGVIEDIGLIISGLIVVLLLQRRDHILAFRKIKKEGPK
jgi:hypothetical protein